LWRGRARAWREAGGEADMAEARAIQADIADKYAGYGVK
jgi:hypothetical protein